MKHANNNPVTFVTHHRPLLLTVLLSTERRRLFLPAYDVLFYVFIYFFIFILKLDLWYCIVSFSVRKEG